MTTLGCGDFSAEALGRYVSGTLEEDAARPFEEHLVGCSRCQGRLRNAVALRKVLRGSKSLASRAEPRRAALRWITPLAAAAGIGAIWFAAATRPAPLVRLGALAGAPPVAVMTVRTNGDSIAAWVGRGLDAYRAGRFAEAALLFGRADAPQPSPGTRYYHGASLLMAGDSRGAIDALSSLAEDDAAPFGAEARFLLAKAWLRLGQADSALTQLERIPRSGHPLAPIAAALAESVRVVIR